MLLRYAVLYTQNGTQQRLFYSHIWDVTIGKEKHYLTTIPCEIHIQLKATGTASIDRSSSIFFRVKLNCDDKISRPFCFAVFIYLLELTFKHSFTFTSFRFNRVYTRIFKFIRIDGRNKLLMFYLIQLHGPWMIGARHIEHILLEGK